MINKLKNNTKIKLISFLSALALWMYVMAVVDPEETRLIEDVPITISNMSELKENDLVIYPETELTTDIRITGKLSNIQKVKKERIHISGQINDPIEGNNKVYLKANISERVSHEFKNDIEIINLEKKIKESRDIDVKVKGALKDNVQVVKLSSEAVKISGPRTLVKQVKEVIGTLTANSDITGDFSQKVELKAVDIDGKEVKGIEMSKKYVDVDVALLTQKTVPIKINFSNTGDIEYNRENYEISKSTIVIKGKKEILDSIEYIETNPVNLANINESSPEDAILVIPKGILTDDKYITIKLKSSNNNSLELNYKVDDIEIRGNSENSKQVNLKPIANIKVRIEYTGELSGISNSDLLLYIDLGDKTQTGDKYEIGYDTKYKFDKVVIEPSEVVVEVE